MDQIMQIASDILLGAGALAAAAYCIVLARRLKKFNNLENGVGGAVAVLSAQVDDMTRTLDKARKAAALSSATLTALTERAEDAARKLELMMASLHDLPEAPPAPAAKVPPVAPVAATRGEAAQDADWAATAERAEGDDEPRLLFSTKRRQARGAA